MNSKVTVIDYGIGNLFSVCRAIEACGGEVLLTDSVDLILKAERLILPGVGAFTDGMKGLKDKSLIETIKAYAQSGKPLLGICLGMQMLLDTSEEFGEHAGLGLVPGEVKQIPNTTLDGKPHKIPHIGWNALEIPSGLNGWKDSILDGVETGSAVYFVHSFTTQPAHPEHRLADTHYNGRLISAAIRKDNIYGCQFHPERSGPVGLKIVNNFLNLTF